MPRTTYTFPEVKTAGGGALRHRKSRYETQVLIKRVILKPGRQREQLRRLVTLAAYRLQSTYVRFGISESKNGYLLPVWGYEGRCRGSTKQGKRIGVSGCGILTSPLFSSQETAAE